MPIQMLFKKYEEEITNHPEVTKIFEDSGLVNEYKTLDFGFFPLGSGLLLAPEERANCHSDIAKMRTGGVMVLGNDFGTCSTVTGYHKKTNGEESNTTVREVLQLGLQPETTFYTNFYLGLRNDVCHPGTTSRKRIVALTSTYKKLCYSFFLKQLQVINPKTVLCLGAAVGDALAENAPDVFASFATKSKNIMARFAENGEEHFVIPTEDKTFGKRKFILVPHPSSAYRYWKGNVRALITKALES